MRTFFREHPAIGQRDRGLLADRAYSVLRNRRLFAHLAESGSGPLERRMALIADARSGQAVMRPSAPEREWLQRLAQIDEASFPDPVRHSLPDWLAGGLAELMPPAQQAALGQYLLQGAPLDIRINPLKADRHQVGEQLEKANIGRLEVSPDGPLAGLDTLVRLQGHPALERLPGFEAGWFEVQDAGSQLVAQLCGARRGQTVVDFCAGAGGKTLALAASMRSRGQLYAFDVSDRRLAAMRPRLARSGATNVQPMRLTDEGDARLKRLAGRADLVLVDAPCSGTGTLRRNPDLKWRHDAQVLARLFEQQQSILTAASRLVKPGGRLVYVTCSLLARENEQVALAFEAAHGAGFVREDLVAGLALPGERPPMPAGSAGFLRLWPHLDDCDGFFAAAWRKAVN
ncbi:MAG: RsmB/NOP family class I SAM-dependent RNA methyltransferase [Burkholderiaceae bacterium]